MAKKKFFNKKVYNKKKNIIMYIIIGVCVIGVIVCFILTKKMRHLENNNKSNYLKDSVTIEINSKLPEKEELFTNIEKININNIDINFENVNISKIGTYDIVVKMDNQEFASKIIVEDNTSPVLTVKDVTINKGDTYHLSDFIDSCTDNSKEQCSINYYENGTDENGNIIDYSNYSQNGTYQIKIIAKDSSNNEIVKTATLQIGKKVTETTCSFGNLEYDSSYIITSYVDSNNCAVDPRLSNDETLRANINNIMNTETKKIQNEINNIKGLNKSLTVNRTLNAVLNKEGIGIVGYSLLIEVKDSDGNIIVKYTLDSNNNRIYIENPYELD